MGHKYEVNNNSTIHEQTMNWKKLLIIINFLPDFNDEVGIDDTFNSDNSE